MNLRKSFVFSPAAGSVRLLSGVLTLLCLAVATIPAAAEQALQPRKHTAYRPGEKLTYVISWSDLVKAGTAVMEVRRELTPEGKETLQFISTARSSGVVETFYPVRDVIKSVFDPRAQASLSYTMNSSHGKKKKQRELIFDHEKKQVTYLKDGNKAVVEIPEATQDALSSLYVLRTQETFTTSRPIVINVNDSGKTWAVEVHVLGREMLKTPLGEFRAIKVKTYPKYEGVFMHKGEIFMWFTDDEHRVPLLMKSTITIGSVMATLTEMKLGENVP
jgi:hypothetical protein